MSEAKLFFIDGKYVRPQYVCITLIIKNDTVAIIDTGNKDAIEPIKEVLTQNGLNWSNVQYVIPTHAHLDHAGGAGLLIQLCDNATLICHPKAARHLIDPSRLVTSTIAVYGEHEFSALYGDIVPIESSRVHVLNDNDTIDLAGDTLQAIDAPGHCYHQMALHHIESNTVICGDAFGMIFPTLKGNFTNFVFPSTSPTQFNPDAMTSTFDRILDLKPQTVQVAHFGIAPDPQYARDQMNRILDDYFQFATTAYQDGASEDDLTNVLMQYHLDYLFKHHGSFSPEFIEQQLRFSIGINAQGLLHYQKSIQS